MARHVHRDRALASLIWLIPWALLVPRDAGRSSSAVSAAKSETPFVEVLKSPAIWGILIGTFCYSCYLFFCITWLPAYFKEQRKLPLELMGLYTMFSFAGMALTTIIFGWAADRLIVRGGDPVRVRKAFTIVGLLLAATEVFGAAASFGGGCALLLDLLPGRTRDRYGELLGAYPDGCTPAGQSAGSVAFRTWQVTLRASQRLYLQVGLYNLQVTIEAPMQAIAVLLVMGAASYALLVRRDAAQS